MMLASSPCASDASSHAPPRLDLAFRLQSWPHCHTVMTTDIPGTRMNPASIRINARLTGEDARRFIELTQGEGGLSASDLLRDALREYYARHAKARPNAFELMQASGYIGGFGASADQSSDYKDYLATALEEKFPSTVNEPKTTYAAKKTPQRGGRRKGSAR